MKGLMKIFKKYNDYVNKINECESEIVLLIPEIVKELKEVISEEFSREYTVLTQNNRIILVPKYRDRIGMDFLLYLHNEGFEPEIVLEKSHMKIFL